LTAILEKTVCPTELAVLVLQELIAPSTMVVLHQTGINLRATWEFAVTVVPMLIALAPAVLTVKLVDDA